MKHDESEKIGEGMNIAILPYDIQIWAQMFFDDGSVSQGYRVSAGTYDDNDERLKLVKDILHDLNRTEGLLILWGAGDMWFSYYNFTFSSEQ